ncbi:MAG: pilus assembly protein, partial [Stenotrophobium sp.]
NALILYARGYNVTSASASATTLASVTARSQSQGLHGAVLHSRPVAINYGARSGYSAAHPDVRVVYGANDGFLRMVQSNTSTGTESGAESWAFMPRVVMNQQLGLLNNAAGGPFPYGPDGAPTALVIDRSGSGGPGDGIIDSSNSNDHAYVFFGLRRGGNYYYGLDVTNPDSPKIMWRIGPDGLYNSSGLVGGSSGWFTHLALTFSAPQAGLLNVSGTPTYVLVFGGGYNGGRDKNNNRLGKDLSGSSGNVGADDTLGNALYIVNAQTGALIWKAEQGTFNATTPFNSSTLTYSHPLLSDSIPSDVTLIDTDGDGYVDRLYVADTGGHLWRGDFAGSDPSKWTLAPVVSVGRHINSDPADDRRFFEAPDYVAVRGPNGNYDAIAFASGDREDPLSLSTQDALYVYRDPIITSGLTASQIITAENILKHNTDFTDVTTSCAQKSSACTLAIQGLTTGWKIQLSGSGEKAFSQPLTLGNTVYLSTFLPPSGATTCKPPEGGGNLYAVNISDSTPSASSSITSGGTARSRTAAAPGLPGELGMAGVTSALASGEIVSTSVRKYYPAYWRERRGDEETPVPQ